VIWKPESCQPFRMWNECNVFCLTTSFQGPFIGKYSLRFCGKYINGFTVSISLVLWSVTENVMWMFQVFVLPSQWIFYQFLWFRVLNTCKQYHHNYHSCYQTPISFYIFQVCWTSQQRVAKYLLLATHVCIFPFYFRIDHGSNGKYTVIHSHLNCPWFGHKMTF
jgi:hypothetical protein